MASRFVGLRVAGPATVILLMLLTWAAMASAQVDPLMFGGNDPVRSVAEQRWSDQFAGWQRLRSSDSAREDRVVSRTRFGSLSRSEAIALAQETFPELLDGNLGPATEFANGVQVAERLDAFTAQLETATGKPAGLKMSTQPMSVEEGGKLVGVDLDVHAADDGFGADQAAAAVELPATSADPVVWEQEGIELQAGRTDDSAAVLRDDRLFFVDGAGADADYALVPTDAGVQVIWQLRTAAAPETVRMNFELPEGAHLEAVREPGLMKFLGARIVGADGSVLQDITAPIVADADGTNIAAQTTIEGDDMVITVRHRGLDLRYPLMIDPVVETWNAGGGFASCGANATGGSWSYTHNSANSAYNFSCWGEGGHGLYVAQANGGYYNQGSSGYWYWNARPDSYIQSVAWNGSRHVTAYDIYGLTGYSLFYAGIWSPGCCWRAYDQWGHSAHYSWTQNANAAADNTQAVLGIITNGGTGSYYDGGIAGLDGASITVNDNYPPNNVDLNSFTPGLQNSSIGSPHRESAWHNMISAPPSLSAKAQDRGLGLQKLTLNSVDNKILWTGINSTCTGLKNWNCPTTLQTTTQTAATGMWQLPEGISEARVVAADVTGKVTAGTTINLKNDTSAPTIAVGGPGWTDRALLRRASGVDITASDGTPGGTAAQQRSGVASIEVRVDEVIVPHVVTSAACSGNSCPLSGRAVIDAYSLSEGTHKISVRATDKLGHSSAPTWWNFVVGPADDTQKTAYEDDGSAQEGYQSALATASSTLTAGPNAALTPGGTGWGLAEEVHGSLSAPEPDFPVMTRLRMRKILPWDIMLRDPVMKSKWGLTTPTYHCPSVGRTAAVSAELPWSASPAGEGETLGSFRKWLAAIGSRQVMVSFGHTRDSSAYCYLPTEAEYLAAFKAFRKEFPQIKEFTPWNEPNDAAQPTSRRYWRGSGYQTCAGLPGGGQTCWNGNGAERAGNFWRIMNTECKATPSNICTAIAGDFVDNSEFKSRPTGTYIENEYFFSSYVHGMGSTADTAKVWAWHSYVDPSTAEDSNGNAKARSVGRLRGFLKSIPSDARVYVTETGGRIHDHRAKDVKPPADVAAREAGYLASANADEQWLLREIPQLSTRVERLYHYQLKFFVDPTHSAEKQLEDWDSGLKDGSGNRRNMFAYFVNSVCKFASPYVLPNALTSCP